MKFVKKSHDGYALESLIILDFQIIIGVLLFEYKRRHFLFYGKKLSPSVSNLILYFIIITLMLINTTIDEIRNVKNNKKYLNTSFVTTKAEIISDSFHYFIGKTKNYLFFYDEKLNKTIIYPMTEIKQLNFAR